MLTFHETKNGERRAVPLTGQALAIMRQHAKVRRLDTALVQEDDALFSDELNHASLIDGCRRSRAQVIRYRHCAPDDLAAALTRTLGVWRRLVITAGVFSMDGEIAPLPQVVKVAAQHEAMVMVDDAPGEGVLGLGGRGISRHFGVLGQVDQERMRALGFDLGHTQTPITPVMVGDAQRATCLSAQLYEALRRCSDALPVQPDGTRSPTRYRTRTAPWPSYH